MSWTKEDRIRQIKIDETIRVYEDDDILVVIPKTIHSMCIYGKGTTWCVASEDERQMVLDGRMESMGCQSTFDDYYERDVMYVFILKNKKDLMGRNKKYLMMFEDGRFHDALGRNRSFSKFISNYPKLKLLLLNHVKCGTYHNYPYPKIFVDYINKHDIDKKFENPFELELNADLTGFNV